MWIEIFRSGVHKDSSGKSHQYSAEDVEQIAKKYNISLEDNESSIAPLVKGHPESNEPAYGWVERLARRGDKLYAKMKELSPEIIRNVRDGMFKKISIALYPDLMLRHVGLLGAVPPAVKGMRNVEFHDSQDFQEFDLEDYYCLMNPVKENAISNQVNIPEKSKSNMDENMIRQYQEKIELLEKEKRLLEFRDYVNSMISAEDGAVITPAQGELLIDILENAHFANIDKAETRPTLTDMIMAFVSKMKPTFTTKEFAVNGKTQNEEHGIDYSKSNVSMDRLNLHERALEIKRSMPGMAYEEAVCMVRRGE